MSIEMMSRIWRYQWRPNELIVLLALADFADDDGSNVFPSMAYLAWKTGYQVRNVKRIVSSLRERRILRVVEPASRHRPVHYRIDLTHAVRKQPFERGNQGGQDDTPEAARGVPNGQSGVHASTPKPSVEPSEKSSSTPAPARDAEPAPGSLREYLPAALSEMSVGQDNPQRGSTDATDGSVLLAGIDSAQRQEELQYELEARGVDSPVARALVEQHDLGHVAAMLARGAKEKVGPGWYVKAIRRGYDAKDGPGAMAHKDALALLDRLGITLTKEKDFRYYFTTKHAGATATFEPTEALLEHM